MNEQALVTVDDEILKGTPVFVGSRLPVEVVVKSLAAGIGLERLRESYPWLTEDHVRAAQRYMKENPTGKPRRRKVPSWVHTVKIAWNPDPDPDAGQGPRFTRASDPPGEKD